MFIVFEFYCTFYKFKRAAVINFLFSFDIEMKMLHENFMKLRMTIFMIFSSCSVETLDI